MKHKQYVTLEHYRRRLSPEKKLGLAIIARAGNDLRGFYDARAHVSAEKKQIQEDAAQYVLSDDGPEVMFSFAYWVQVLDLSDLFVSRLKALAQEPPQDFATHQQRKKRVLRRLHYANFEVFDL